MTKHFFRSWQQHAGVQVATFVVLTATFIVISVSFLIHQNFNQLLSQWGDSVKLSVFLKDEATDKDKNQVRKFLEDSSGASRVDFVSKESAVESFSKHMAKFHTNFEFDEALGNPLPSSFEVRFGEQLSGGNYTSMLEVAKKVVGMSAVEDVSYGQGWVENYSSLVSRFHGTSYFLVALLLAGSLFVIGNSIRTSVAQRREEIEVLELIGGTKVAIRGPYIFEGFVMGLLSALAAVTISYVIYRLQHNIGLDEFGLWSSRVSVSFLSFTRIFSVLVVGGVFGAFGAYLCVRKVCSGWAAAAREQ